MDEKHKQKKRPLKLKRQTIRQLSPEEMNEANGGIIWTTTVTVTTVTIDPDPAH